MKNTLEKFYRHFVHDTQFAELMNRRIYNVLLIATKYDLFSLEEDGRIDEQIFNEYMALSLRYPPRFTRAHNKDETLMALSQRTYELIIVMPNLDKHDVFFEARELKILHPETPIVVLTPFSKEISKRVENEDLSFIDYIFSWLGEAELLIAIIKLIEDKWNALPDTSSVGVQIILVVEDSVRTYSAALCKLYQFVLAQSQEFAKEALNEHLKTLRMRGRPKILLARNHEEAVQLYNTYGQHILGIISDLGFKRQGVYDPLAGVSLCRLIRERSARIPIILQSSNTERGKKAAQQLSVAFLPKSGEQYLSKLEQAVAKLFGFGTFHIINPDTQQVIMQIHDLKDLQQKIYAIPDRSLYYHLKKDHFSRFFYSRALFPLARVVKDIQVYDEHHLDEIRTLISNLIGAYRKLRNTGVIADFEEHRFDEYSNFTKIGKGSLGGKGRGLAFMTTWNLPADFGDAFHIQIPQTVVICTDIFDEFMEMNQLYPLALNASSDMEVLQAFDRAALPERMTRLLYALSKVSRKPIAIRSSSLLEDSHYQPFAGVYATYMVPIITDVNERMAQLCHAIKGVYASVFYKAGKAYLQSTQNLIEQEKMAIVMQEVVGQTYGDYYYPLLSGVAHSNDFYPVGNEKPTDGVMHLALGLGKYVVDGGRTLRVSPQHPQRTIQQASMKSALKDTQKQFYALDLKNHSPLQTDETYNLRRLNITAENIPEELLSYAVSTYDTYNNTMLPGYYPTPQPTRLVVSFAGLLHSHRFPLARAIREFLTLAQSQFGRPVEIEFALNHDAHTDHATLAILQVRPTADCKTTLHIRWEQLQPDTTLLLTSQALGNGCYEHLTHVVWVKTHNYNPKYNQQINSELEHITSTHDLSKNGYILIGPGRWGSSDPWLGIPVKWNIIRDARIIVEYGLKGYAPEASQATHFFQNVTSLGIGYLTLSPYRSEDYLNLAFLQRQHIIGETEHVALLELSAPCTAYIDGAQSRGVIMLPE